MYAAHGIVATIKSETSFKLEILALVLVLGLLLYLQPDPIWWALVTVVSAGVLAAELMNTALERALDKLHPVRDPLIGLAKDCAAGAVLVMSVASLGVLFALLWQYS
jgi:undecaprenol kinase